MVEDEAYWKQWSMIDWLKVGDKNTRFFHRKASARKVRNEILGLYDENGKWCVGDKDMEQIIVGYFSRLFTSNSQFRIEVDQVLSSVKPRLSQRSSDFLDKLFTPEEIRCAVFDMAATKALGSNGLPAMFYQKYWGIVGGGVVSASLKCLNEGASIRHVNETIVCLIPKGPSTQRITKFRPISLCNVIYKVVAKALANRL
ncbi:hypothetical protein Ddye_017485 [Dipteronia dyeriana]|uniref:Reverse transcriptase n=1 Tax=Dipteronia dyeriana TaxID=168575 RepID=A0AAD9X0K3_9ROSI|nr:hypothetical protein Ddye_017485 [Dipteronia dyeriana]